VPLDNVQVVTGKGVTADWGQHLLRIGSAQFCNAGDDTDRAVYLAIDNEPCCRFWISDEVRADAREAVTALRDLGITPIMLSGDADAPCRELAEKLDIAYLARQTPESKLEYLQRQSAAGHRTLMIGDGINDVPVLAGADVSATVLEASDLVKSKADILFLTRRLTPLPELIRTARRTLQITHQNLFWALAYNLTAIPIAALGWMPPWLAALGMASSSTLVMFNATRILR
jgi:Cu2+-exporting ATPase